MTEHRPLVGVMKPVNRANGLPNAHYIDPHLFQEEKRAVLFANWSGIGFGAEVRSASERAVGEVLRDVEPEDLVKFGLIPELVGRLPVVATLDELNDDALVQILIEPKNALVKQYQQLFSMEGVDLEIRPAAVQAIARRALRRKTGARGLRSILEQTLLDIMFDLPTRDDVVEVKVTEGTFVYVAIDEQGRPRALPMSETG